MKILKSRGAAAAIAVIIVVLATLFGVHRSVGAQIEKLEQTFYDGVYIEKGDYTETSIASQLAQRSNAANGLVSVAGGFDALQAETKAMREARNSLIEAERISEMYDANIMLQDAYEALYPLLLDQDLSENQRAAAENYRSTMDGAQAVIDRSAYNEAVEEFESGILGAFPVNLLKYPAFAGSPEKFE